MNRCQMFIALIGHSNGILGLSMYVCGLRPPFRKRYEENDWKRIFAKRKNAMRINVYLLFSFSFSCVEAIFCFGQRLHRRCHCLTNWKELNNYRNYLFLNYFFRLFFFPFLAIILEQILLFFFLFFVSENVGKLLANVDGLQWNYGRYNVLTD